ncbi:M23 family metallopeptidase [Amphibacillus cookii]|uniref:M23 family metallopeptidase n=1 Tax=Amphibacillus cookii TaxID=767787 RepID=UPI001EF758E6|nr:peptidoglycan DD-metalloendopeptidase family protein [Amphibacillus cookii]MBM7541014.1 murein DD-endopeptidase MepM/ murein hydrolase activator NlpD [Amphibacillus cookii]
MPHFVILFVAILFLLPITLFIYHSVLNRQLLTTNASLHDQVEHLEEHTEVLSMSLDELKSERDTVIERFEALDEIEEQLHEYITTLPDEALGGIEIPLSTEELSSLESDDVNTILESSAWLERYQETLTNIEQLEENLQYIPTAWPTEPDTITSSFGPRNDPFKGTQSMHSGMDVRGTIGTPIYAGADGVVTLAQNHGGYGKTIIIDHGGQYETLYAHLSAIDVNRGDQVIKGEKIGELGNTGRSTGPHLHYEVIKDGVPVDPEYYINFFDNEDE